MQDGLNYLALPPEINLGDPGNASAYQKVTVKMDYQRFHGSPVFGAPRLFTA